MACDDNDRSERIIIESTPPGVMRFAAALCGFVAICFLAAGIWTTWSLATRFYLEQRGVEAQGIVTEMVYHPVRYGRRRRQIAPVTLTYTFRLQNGETTSTTLERDQSQMGDIVRGTLLQILYAEAWPTLNLPRRLIDVTNWTPLIPASFGAFGLALFMGRRFWQQAA